MEYPRLIHEYLDGELNPILEDKLFSEMAINQDVRSEFSKQLKLQNITNLDLNSIDIPSDTTAAVFAGLGFSIPSTGMPNVGVRYYWSWLQNNGFRKASIVLILLLSIAGAFRLTDSPDLAKSNQSTNKYPLISSIQSGRSESENNNRVFASNNAAKPLSTTNHKYSLPKSIKTMATSSTKPDKQFIADNLENNSVNSRISESETSISDDQSNENRNGKMYSAIAYSPYSSRSNNVQLTEQKSLINSFVPLNLVDLPGLQTIDPNFEISWSNSNKYYGKTNNLPKDNNSFLQGNGLSIAYKFNSEHSVGIDLGEETFYQEFNYHNGEQIATYKQMPDYFWGGLSYKYSPEFIRLGESIQPFTKIILGGAKGGAIGKLQMGINIKLTPSISAFATGEYGTMIYNIKTTIYQSNKYQILYGLSLNF